MLASQVYPRVSVGMVCSFVSEGKGILKLIAPQGKSCSYLLFGLDWLVMFAFLHIASGILGTVLSDHKYNRSLKQY